MINLVFPLQIVFFQLLREHKDEQGMYVISLLQSVTKFCSIILHVLIFIKSKFPLVCCSIFPWVDSKPCTWVWRPSVALCLFIFFFYSLLSAILTGTCQTLPRFCVCNSFWLGYCLQIFAWLPFLILPHSDQISYLWNGLSWQV